MPGENAYRRVGPDNDEVVAVLPVDELGVPLSEANPSAVSGSVSIVDQSDPTQVAQVTDVAPASNAKGLVVRLIGNINLGSEVEINNDSGNPIPVSLSAGDLVALELVGVKGGDSSTIASSANPFPVNPDRYEFARIMEKRLKDTEEIRYDIPAALPSASIYTGVAPDGTATSAAVWTVIRAYFDAAGKPSRQRIRFNMTWDGRASGWT